MERADGSKTPRHYFFLFKISLFIYFTTHFLFLQNEIKLPTLFQERSMFIPVWIVPTTVGHYCPRWLWTRVNLNNIQRFD